MVTKQQQLEWLALNIDDFFGMDVAQMSGSSLGRFRMAIDGKYHIITREEWQQERDKMQNEKSVITGGIYLTRNGFRFEVVDIAKAGSDCSIDMVVYVNLDATNDFPPGPKWVLELESFISKFKLDSGRKPAPDNSWHERGEFPPVGVVCMAHITSEDKWVEAEIVAHRDGYALGWCHAEKCGYHGNENSDFRPLRTEREKAIDAACDVICKNGVHDFERGVITKLYDAGMLK